MRRDGVSYTLHHIGIPTTEVRPGERQAARVGMHTTDDFSGPLPVQWHRFDTDSPLHPLLRQQPQPRPGLRPYRPGHRLNARTSLESAEP